MIICNFYYLGYSDSSKKYLLNSFLRIRHGFNNLFLESLSNITYSCVKFHYRYSLPFVCRLNEEMIETLFVVKDPTLNTNDTARSFVPSPNQENRVLDPKKAQNIAIFLRALNVTTEKICEALLEGIHHFHRSLKS